MRVREDGWVGAGGPDLEGVLDQAVGCVSKELARDCSRYRCPEK